MERGHNSSPQDRFQALRLNSTRIGYISNRPKIIAKDSTNLLNTEKAEKFPMGPTISNPGPTLLMQVMTAVRVVVKEKLSNPTTTAMLNTKNRLMMK